MSVLGRRRVVWAITLGLCLGLHPGGNQSAMAQGGAFLAPPEAMDTLSGASTGGGDFGGALDRANNAAAAANAATAGGGLGALPAAPAQPVYAEPGVIPTQPGGYGGAGTVGTALNAAGQAVAGVIPLTVTVIDGTRIFDAITGELLDDAVEKKVSEEERANYFDDGTHGDITPDDGTFTRVDERRDVIGQSSQRVKERLLQALVSAEALNPLEFYGFNIMSLSVGQEQARTRVWQLVPDPEGGPGQVLREQDVENPVRLPSFREWQVELDGTVKNNWSMRFLHEYRKNKDSLTSDFYTMYVPFPPQMPTTSPPALGSWQPFGGVKIERVERPRRNSGGGGGGGEMMSPGATGLPMGNASSRYF